MWSKEFWRDAAERAAKTAGQFGVGALGGQAISLFELDFLQVLGVMAFGAVLSVCTSVASIKVGKAGVASLLK